MGMEEVRDHVLHLQHAAQVLSRQNGYAYYTHLLTVLPREAETDEHIPEVVAQAHIDAQVAWWDNLPAHTKLEPGRRAQHDATCSDWHAPVTAFVKAFHPFPELR